MAAGETLSKSGGCLCGAVRFSARLATTDVDVCHCSMCRRWTGGVYMCVGVDDVSFDDERSVSTFGSSEHGERVFCRTCGSSLFWRMKDGSGAWVSVHALDDASGLVFAEEIFIDDKPALYEFANDTRKLTGAQFFERAAAGQENAGG